MSRPPGIAAGRKWTAPALAMALSAGCVGWAYPDDLPPWRAAAIVVAWAGSGLLAASLVLMVRAPRLAWLLGGLEPMYRWHHRSGTIAYVLLLGHPLALAIDGLSESPQTAWGALAPWAQSWPVWLGWASLLLLMVGLVTSFALRLPYRRWRGWHYLLGLGVVLGLTHVVVLLGQAGLAWALIGLAVLALGWRLTVSDFGWFAHPYVVTRVESRAARMIEAALAPCATALPASAGQFVLAAFGDGAHYRGCGEFHPFTVSAIEAGGALKIGVKALGPCSERIQHLEPGVLLRLQGPFGSFLAEANTGPQLWIAGGIGITPFMAALRQRAPISPTTLMYLYRTDADAAFLDELRRLAAAEAQFDLVARACGDGLPDIDGLLTHVSGLTGRQVQLCGPPAMVEAFRTRLMQRGLPATSIHAESFDFR